MNNKLQEYKEIVQQGLRKHPWDKYFYLAEQKTGFSRDTIFNGMVIVASFCLMFGYAAQFISYAIGIVYPVYMTILAVELSKKDQHKKWLTYWIIFASFALLDCFAGFILRLFPLYWYSKTVFLIWCYFPTKENTCMMVYNSYIHPFYMEYLHQEPVSEEDINRVLNVMKGLKGIKETSELNLNSLRFDGPQNQPMRSRGLFGFSFKRD